MTRNQRLEQAGRAIGAHREVVGWGTVDLERAARSVVPGDRTEPVPNDELVGGRGLLVRPGGSGDPVLLLEPSTEGPLAATLARHGEGPAVTYLVAGADPSDRLRDGGLALSAEAGTPLGRGRLILGGDRWGPHLIAVWPDSARALQPLPSSDERNRADRPATRRRVRRRTHRRAPHG
jgi:hypothetical protein